jgi:hypothetical protein
LLDNYIDTGKIEYTQPLCILGAIVVPVLITRIISNRLQKTDDKTAVNITEKQYIINGIRALVKLKKEYIRESDLGRLFSTLKLTPVLKSLFYPIRASTPEERINYLQEQCINSKTISYF